MATASAIKTVHCPRCNATPGNVCRHYARNHKGTPVRPHVERIIVYERSFEPTSADETTIARWAKITEPREALRYIIDNQQFLSSDPRHAEFRAALLEMAERCVK